MGLRTIEDNRVADTVTANKKFFSAFCLVGFLLVGAGILSLRLDKTISATGVVVAGEERYVFAPSSGILGQQFVRIGQEVEAGTPLFSLDGDDVDLRLLEKQREVLDIQSEISALALALEKAEIQPSELAERQKAGFPALERKELEQKLLDRRRVREVLDREVELLERQREGLRVVSPIAGTVVDIYHRYAGMGVRDGERVMKIANVENGYRVRAFVGDRNVDLLEPGVPARMESRVFDPMFEGYVTGSLRRIVGEADWEPRGDGRKPGYEVTVDVEETPYPLVLGSRMKIDFLLGRQSLLALIMNRPAGGRGEGDGNK